MFKALRYHPEIVDLWVWQSRKVGKALKYLLVLGVHLILFWLVLTIGSLDPYTSYKGSSEQTEVHYYDFSRLGKTFYSWDHYRLEEIDGNRLEELLISSVPRKLQAKLKKHLSHTLKLCEYYQIDPLWVLSVMWTESHFNEKAISRVNAKGLMQIMPGTAHYLLNKMNRPVEPKIAYELVKNPQDNVEMGVFYLRRLFINFDFNFSLATVAYNMGPNGVWRRLKNGQRVGQNHLYLKKVRRHYRKLLKPVRSYLKNNPAPYTRTNVVKPSKNLYIEANLFSDLNSLLPPQVAINHFSQRLEL